MNTFENLNLSEGLMKSINRLGYKEPTQIQRQTIPLILKGKDVIGESATGSGKTLAFGAGIIEKCNPRQGIQAVVLVPTRELAEQVKDEMIKISFNKQINIIAIYGGVSINPQITNLRKSEVVIATPGRLLDHLDRRTINTSKVKIVVLDEADRMVEMGFIEDVERIIKSFPRERQTLLFSATMYGHTQKIARKYMGDPTIVHAEKMIDPTKLKQTYYDAPTKLKTELLVHLLKKESSDLVMVFCNTRRVTEMLVAILKDNKIKSAPIHGGLKQTRRLQTIDMFHNGKFGVLVCTDVASRGLHIEGVTHIYNFDIPKEPGDYIHRIGRTARAGKTGCVINILAPRDYNNFSRVIENNRDFKIQKKERPYLKVTNQIRSGKNYSRKLNDLKSKRDYSRNNSGPKKHFSRNSRFKSKRNNKRRYN